MADEGVGQMSISEFDDDDVMMGCVRSCCPIVTLSALFFNAEVKLFRFCKCETYDSLSAIRK